MQLNSKQRYNLHLLAIIIPFLMGVNIDLYVPALPTIANYFNAPIYLAQFTVAAYVFAYGTGQLFFGILSDCIGRRKIIVVCLGVYAVISLGASIATNIYLIICFRFAQGLCLAGAVVTIRAIVKDVFTGLEFAKTINNISMSWALGPIVGPFIGGYLQHLFNWQADFYFFSAYGAFVFAAALIALPETLHNSLKMRPANIFATLKTIVTHHVFMLASLIGMLLYAILVLFNVISPFYIQNILHYSPVVYGNIALLMGLSYFIGNGINRMLIAYLCPRYIVNVALCFALLFSIVMLACGIVAKPNIYFYIVPASLLFTATGIIFPNIVAKFSVLFEKGAGTAGAVAGAIAAGGVAVISAMITTAKTTTATPLAGIYFVIAFCCVCLVILMQKIERRGRP